MDPEAVAAALVGDGPPELLPQLVALIKRVGRSPEVQAWLDSRLTVPDIIDLQTQVAMAEPDYVERYGTNVHSSRPIGSHILDHEWRLGRSHNAVDQGPPPEAWGVVDGTNDIRAQGLVSREAKRAVSLMYLRGFNEEQIAFMLVLPVDRVRFHLAQQENRDRNRTIVRDVLNGMSVAEASRRAGVTRNVVYETLERAGAERPPDGRRTKTHDRAVRLRAEGHTYEQIRSATGLSTNQLRKLFQRRSSEIPGYGGAREEAA